MPGADTRAHLPGVAMLDRWAYVEFARFIGCCWLVGSVLGLIVFEVRERMGERRA